MATRLGRASLCISLMLLVCAPLSAQISFPKNHYYLSMGDSIAAGVGAVPMTHGFAFQLYDRAVFGEKTETIFVNMALPGARTWEVRDHQVPQVLCSIRGERPSVVTMIAGANDLFMGDPALPAIAARVAQSVDLLLNNGTGLVSSPVLDPRTGIPCPALSNVTILVANYYRVPERPDLDPILSWFDLALRSWLAAIPVPPGSRVVLVDLLSASEGRTGLVLSSRHLGSNNVHPTNAGHAFIAEEFAAAWKGLP